MKLFRLAMVATLLALTLHAQAPEEAAPPPEPPRTRVRGRVVDADSNLPLKGARVISGGFGDGQAGVETNFDGTFELPDVVTGEQAIRAFKSAYIEAHERIRIPVGRELDGVRIELHRAAVITGTVTGPDGAALAGAQVRVLRRGYSDGIPVFFPAARMFGGGSAADDRGIFRVWDLPPGAYIVAVDPVAQPGPRGETVYSSGGLYYPNVQSVEEAGRVRVDWGQVQEAIDLRLGPPAPTRVEGAVQIAEGGDCQACMAQLHRQEGAAWVPGGRINVSRDGAFSVAGLAPGHYALAVQAFMMRNMSMAFGAAEFDAIEQRVTQVLVETHGEQPVKGRLVLEGPPATVVAPEVEAWHAMIHFRQRPGDPFSAPGSRGSFVDVSGKGPEVEFELTPTAGRQMIAFQSLPEGGYVRGISIGGQPIKGPDITVPEGGLEDVVIAIAFDSGTVSGRIAAEEARVADAGLLPPPGIVRLIPEGGAAPFANNLMGSAQPDGYFEIRGLAPGAYRVFAVPEETNRLMDDPATVAKLAAWSKAVVIKPGQTTNLNLELAPRLEAVE